MQISFNVHLSDRHLKIYIQKANISLFKGERLPFNTQVLMQSVSPSLDKVTHCRSQKATEINFRENSYGEALFLCIFVCF